MKVFFVNRYYAPDHSATSQMLTDLACALAAGGADVHVITSRLRYDNPGAGLRPHEVIDGVEIHRVATTRFGRSSLAGRAFDYFSFYVTASLALLSLVRADDIVVTKTDPPLVSVPAGWIALFRRARHVNWLQDLFPEVAAELGLRTARGHLGKLLAWLRDKSLLRASRNVVIGRTMYNRLAARGINPDSMVVIPNWADGGAVRPVSPDLNPLRDEWGLAGKIVVGYSGNMGRAHEFATITAAAHALRERPDIVFLFIGSGAQEDQISLDARERAMNVVFKPYQPRAMLAQSLSVADIHLVSLRQQLEGLIVPSKIYGILAVWRPTVFVGAGEGEVGVLLCAHESGMSIPEGDVNGLVAALAKLADDASLRSQMGASARRAFEDLFDKHIQILRWTRLLEELEHKQVR